MEETVARIYSNNIGMQFSLEKYMKRQRKLAKFIWRQMPAILFFVFSLHKFADFPSAEF
jgi:hypothetical protein